MADLMLFQFAAKRIRNQKRYRTGRSNNKDPRQGSGPRAHRAKVQTPTRQCHDPLQRPCDEIAKLSCVQEICGQQQRHNVFDLDFELGQRRRRVVVLLLVVEILNGLLQNGAGYALPCVAVPCIRLTTDREAERNRDKRARIHTDTRRDVEQRWSRAAGVEIHEQQNKFTLECTSNMMVGIGPLFSFQRPGHRRERKHMKQGATQPRRQNRAKKQHEKSGHLVL